MATSRKPPTSDKEMIDYLANVFGRMSRVSGTDALRALADHGRDAIITYSIAQYKQRIKEASNVD